MSLSVIDGKTIRRKVFDTKTETSFRIELEESLVKQKATSSKIGLLAEYPKQSVKYQNIPQLSEYQ